MYLALGQLQPWRRSDMAAGVVAAEARWSPEDGNASGGASHHCSTPAVGWGLLGFLWWVTGGVEPRV